MKPSIKAPSLTAIFPLHPELTELVVEPVGPKRVLHSLAFQAPLRFAGCVLQVGMQVATAHLVDTIVARGPPKSQTISNEVGLAPAATDGRRIALYMHYSGSGQISPMVCEQLRGYRALGFDMVFITNANAVDEKSWRAAAQHCWKLIRRQNFGLDFGGWQDAAALLLGDLPPPEELLLVNDSILGPIHPLAPLFAHARGQGLGVVGLTESRQGGVHLQSYFLLILGAAATADTLEFLVRLRLSKAKWLMVQRGEFGLTRFLVRRGHRVAALFGYARVLDAILECEAERRYLVALAPQLAQHINAPERLRALLLQWPLNPTMHMWRGLARCLGFPFIKAELIRRNPGRLPGVGEWPTLMTEDVADLIRQHLASLEEEIGRCPPSFPSRFYGSSRRR